MKTLILSTIALVASACTLNTPVEQDTIYAVGDEVIDDEAPVALCGPEDNETDKINSVPQTSAFGTYISGKTYYPAYHNIWVRSYSLGDTEKNLNKIATAMSTYWAGTVTSFNVQNASEATVSITASSGPLYPGCELGVSGDCWYAGTSCTAYQNTNATNIRLCTHWKIEMNFPSMYLWADSRGIPRENMMTVIMHEVGHTMGFPHRNNTLMSPGVKIPGSTSTPHWEDMPRYDACQVAALRDYAPDNLATTEIDMIPAPTECQ